MKLKNISIFEQHIEKVIVAIAVILLGYVVYTRVVQDPFVVEMDGQEYRPSQIDEVILEEARRLDSDIDPRNLSGIQQNLIEEISQQAEAERGKLSKYADDFTTRLTRPLLDPSLAFQAIASGSYSSDPEIDLPPPPEQNKYNLETPPAPTEIAASAAIATLASNPNTDPIIAARGTADLAVVSIAASYPMNEWRTRLNLPDQRVGEGDNPTIYYQIPERWQEEGYFFVDVQVYRRQLQPDGSWSKPKLLDPLPGQPSFRDYIRNVASGTNNAGELGFVDIMQSQQRLAAPSFYEVTYPSGGLKRIELPSEAEERRLREAAAEAEAAADPRNAAIAQLNTAILNIGQELDLIDRAIARHRETISRAGSDETRIANVRRLLEQEEAKRAEREEVRLRLTADLNRLQANRGGVMNEQPQVTVAEAFNPARMDTLRLTAYDITAEPGMTYQYQMRVVFKNPLQGKQIDPEQREEMARQFGVTSELSPWTEPVAVNAGMHYFITGSEEIRGSSEIVARAVVLKFQNAAWHRHEALYGPGETIGTKAAMGDPVDYRTTTAIIAVDPEFRTPSERTTRVLLLDQFLGEISARLTRDEQARLEMIQSEIKLIPTAPN